MWLRSSTLAVTVCWVPPIPTTRSTTGRAFPDFELPDLTRVMLLIGPAPISAASEVSMLVLVAPVSDFASADRDPLVPLTTTSSM